MWSVKQVFDPGIELLCKFIEKKYGIIIQSHQHNSLSTYVTKICKEKDYNDIYQYLSELKGAPLQSDLLNDLCANITVDESYFFRDSYQMNFLEHEFFPNLIETCRKQNRKTISVWSAGSSNGQELYSILIMLDKLIPNDEHWNVYAIGTDINEEVLTTARNGIYSYLAFRTTPQYIKDAYFDDVNVNQAVIIDRIRKKAEFRHLNLKSQDYESVVKWAAGFDLILCRNVFIYLDYDLVTRITQKMISMLNNSGVLLLGPSDIIQDNIKGATLIRSNNVIYYSKCLEPVENIKHTEMQAEKSQNICPIISDTQTEAALVARDKDLENVMPAQSRTDSQGSEPQVVTEKLREIALQCANAADYDQGLDMIEKCLKQEEFNEENYFIKGLICMGLKQFSEAAAQFKSAMFLNNDFAEAAYQLGICLQMNGDQKAGNKMLKTAFKLSLNADENKRLIASPEVTMHEFSQAI